MNNKIKKLLVTCILGALIVIPISNAQATTPVKEGVYFEKTKEFYTISQLEKLSMVKMGTLFSQNEVTQIYIYFSGIGVANLKQANDLGLIDATNKNGHKNSPENIIPQGNYKDVNGKTITVNGKISSIEFKIISIE